MKPDISSDIRPDIRPVLGPLFEQIKGSATKMVLYNNGTLVLLSDDEDPNKKVSNFKNLNLNNLVQIKFHYFRSYLLILHAQPESPDVCILNLCNNKTHTVPGMMERIKQRAIQSFNQDYEEKQIIFDSTVDKLDDFRPNMYLIVNKDLNMGKGKIAGQVGHAVGHLMEKLLSEKMTPEFTDWKEGSYAKIILKATEEEIEKLKSTLNLPHVEVRDHGLTQIKENSLTVLGFVPVYKKNVPDELRNLSLL